MADRRVPDLSSRLAVYNRAGDRVGSALYNGYTIAIYLDGPVVSDYQLVIGDDVPRDSLNIPPIPTLKAGK